MNSSLILITTSFPKENPGSEAAGSFVEDLAANLGACIKTIVIAPGTNNDWTNNANYRIRRYIAPNKALSSLHPQNPLHWPAIASALYSGQRAVNDAVCQYPSSFLLALWALPSGHWARVAAKKNKLDYAVWALGSDIWSLRRIPLISRRLKLVLRDAVVTFADGYLLRDDISGLGANNPQFLPTSRKLPAMARQRRRSTPRYKMLYIGRWHRNKGVDIMLDALELLSNDDWQRIESICIAGGGVLEDLVMDKTEALYMRGRPVRLLGYQNRDQATSLLNEADYLLIPSRVESIPVVFSDAAQAGCPVIAMPVGDIPRLMKKYDCGLLASGVDKYAFASAIRRGLNTDNSKYCPGLERIVEDFNLTHVVNRIVRLANSCVNA